ncbi:hypothetical protein GPECTOR_8g88 [Gonium pectorale]|uniref:Inositol polyphosphate-related phosphatase domain-containing protein n=1 Tax=Gonium pectorale TaxID=33097 RepID=A0A150GTB5_GONPE|nr:hypothetical protein GPECTOR_8g88 [Gonium pectorale]|eukprot:KXZ53097.1 hypothetical protein GPECTOR_8g88 [Gonium pectorale]
MPQAQSLPPPPPPPYEEAVAMPPAATAPLAATAPMEPIIPGIQASSWADFDGAPSGAAISAVAVSGAAEASAAMGTSSSMTPSQPAPLPSQICVEVRLPPLKPKEAAWPKRLVAGLGAAFAAPGADGVAALQWCLLPGAQPAPGPGHAHSPGVEDAGAGPRFDLPPVPGVQRAQEDWDSAPAAALPLPPALPDSGVSAMLVDELSGSLWTGHKDGRVVRWSVGPGRPALYEHHWKAHARGKVTCLAMSPWGELWTGSSAGSVRSWQYLGGLPASRTPVRLFECRRARLALGPAARASAQRPHSKTRLLAVGPSGRVIWSAGRTGMVLWGAYDGEYLGSLTPGQAPGQEVRAGAPGQGAYAGDTGAVFRDGGWQVAQQQDEINPQTGLDPSLVNRPFVPRAPPDGGDEAEGDPDLGAQVIKGLAGAAKFANKLRKRIQKNLVGDGQGGAEGAGPAGDVSYAQTAGTGAPVAAARGKVVALVAGADSSMYVAYKGGFLEKYTEWGRLLWCCDYGRHTHLHSAALVGALLWIGCGDGTIHTVAAATGELGRSWKAHDFPVTGLAYGAGRAAAGGLVYSLGENGSIRAWPSAPPADTHLAAWRDGLLPSLRRRQLTLLAATWNVNETRPTPQSLRTWLTKRAEAAEVVAISLQEVEMGTSSVARDAAFSFLSKAMLERGNQNAQWWATELAAALAATGQSWVRVALRQMSGLLAVVFCRADLRQHVGEVATANVACGVMGVGGNKGAVAVSMSVFRRRIMFVGSHFAAHQERVDERNDNYAKIVKRLHFDNTSKAAQRQKLQQQAAAGSGGDAAGRENMALDGAVIETDLDGVNAAAAGGAGGAADSAEDDETGPGMSEAEMLVWAGDFNYRINGFYSDVISLACAGEYARLYAADQCKAEMEKGTIFRGMREPLPLGHPVFPPTYKYDKNEPATLAPAAEDGGRPRMYLPYDSSEKQRVPAWTDRIFYRGSRPGSLDVAEEEVQLAVASPHDYNCVMEVNDSDHKPVYAMLQVQLPAYKQDEKRRHSLAAATSVCHPPYSAAPPPLRPVQSSTPALHVRPNGAAAVDLRNTSGSGFIVHVTAERPHYGAQASHGEPSHAPLPGWLEVSPASFMLLPAGRGVEGADAAQSHARVIVRSLGGDVTRTPEPARLHFSLQPLWGMPTHVGAVGPTVTVSLAL